MQILILNFQSYAISDPSLPKCTRLLILLFNFPSKKCNPENLSSYRTTVCLFVCHAKYNSDIKLVYTVQQLEVTSEMRM